MREHDATFSQKVDVRRKSRMEAVDALDRATRALVHDYGYHIIHQFRQAGVVNPKAIRHLVEVVLDEFSPTRGSFSAQGIRTIHED